jgi:hypothetical protein
MLNKARKKQKNPTVKKRDKVMRLTAALNVQKRQSLIEKTLAALPNIPLNRYF